MTGVSLFTRKKSVTLGNAYKRRKLLANVRKRRWRAKLKARRLGAAMDIRTYEDLVEALKAYRHKLGISQAELGMIAGFQDGYLAKLEIPGRNGGRMAGVMSLATWLDALGVSLKVVPRGERGGGALKSGGK